MIRRVDDEGGGVSAGSEASSRSTSAPESGGADAIVEIARRVLEIVPGERRLLPEFGCRIHSLEGFERSRDREVGAALVEEALERWTPGLAVERAEVSGAAAGHIRVSLRLAARWYRFEIKHRRQGVSAASADGGGP